MDCKSILTLDTSAINCLTDDVHSSAFIAGLTSGFHVRLTFTSLSEVIATTLNERRRTLLNVCKRLVSAGDCIGPQNDLLTKLVAHFEQSPMQFAWRTVPVRLVEAEDEIIRQENFGDDLSEQEREFGRVNERVFAKVYDDAKPHFDKLFADGSDKRPSSASELVSRLQAGGAFWTLAANLYSRVAKKPADDSTIRRFVAECTPFRALMIALCAAQYERCVRPPSLSHSLRAGRNDIFMAICLPYCDVFVTNDFGQLECFKEVVSIGNLNVAVRSYGEFRDAFSVLAGVAG